MCTLTWWQQGPRYALFFNRDELKTRLPAVPPDIRMAPGGTKFMAPTDGDHGGAWLLANEHGLSIALLNYYHSGAFPAARAPALSRGRLVLSLADESSPATLARTLAKSPLDDYPPFHLFAIAPRDRPRLWTWRGPGAGLLAETHPEPPVTTSSFQTEAVCARRRERYREATACGANPDALHVFHQMTEEENGAYSVRMRRPDAQTVSFSRIEAGDGEIRFTYRPESPDSLEVNESATVSLPLAK